MDGSVAIRQNFYMPRYARPANSDYAEDPIKALGNMMQATIIGHLRKCPGQTRAEIADALQLPKMTIANGLETLIDAGLIAADPPREIALRGQRVRYIVNESQVSEMVVRLEQVLGEY